MRGIGLPTVLPGFEQGGPIDGYDLVVCAACGTAFADGIPSQEEFDEYYRELSKYEYEYGQAKSQEEIAFG